MSKLSLLLCLAMTIGSLAQLPKPCLIPQQMTLRGLEINHRYDEMRRFFIAYDDLNKRIVMFEEEREIFPGVQLHEYLVLNNDNIEYDINLKTKECTKSIPRRWREWGIPPNATYENAYAIGGPGELVYADEWSDRIPLRQRETWVGSFSKTNCYPISAMMIGPEHAPNDTITAHYYDIVEGIPNPNDFVPPAECNTARWAESSRPIMW